jgi:ribonuclease E
LRIIQEEANKQKCAEVRADVPLIVSSYLLNEKRAALAEIENQSETKVVISANPEMETPHYKITGLNQATEVYDVDITATPEPINSAKNSAPVAAVQRPSVEGVRIPQAPAPSAANSGGKAEKKSGLFAGLFAAIASLFSGAEKEEEKPKRSGNTNRGGRNRSSSRGQRGQQNRNRGDRNNRAAKSDGDEKPATDERDNSGEKTDRGERRSRGGRRGGRNRDNTQDNTATSSNDDSTAENSGGNSTSERSGNDETRRRRSRSRSGDRKEETRGDQKAAENDLAADDKNTNSEFSRRPASQRPKNTTSRKRGPRPDLEKPTEATAATEDETKPEIAAAAPSTAQESEASRRPSLAEALDAISANAMREELPAQSEEPVVPAEVAEASNEANEETSAVETDATSEPSERKTRERRPRRPRKRAPRDQDATATASSNEEVAQTDATPSADSREQSAPVEVSEAAETVEAVAEIQSEEIATQPAEVVVDNTQTTEVAAETPKDVAAQPSPRRRAPNDPRHKRG